MDDVSAIEQRQERKRLAREIDDEQFEGSDATLLLRKEYPGSHYRVPMKMTIHHNVTERLSVMSQTARCTRLFIFMSIELLWLGFALLTNFHIFITGSDQLTLKFPGGLAVTQGALFRSGLSTLGIVIQLIALLPVADITLEFYSSEWCHVLTREDGQLTRITDRVSTLTSTFKDRFAHTFDRRSSRRYRLAFVVVLLSLLLQALAPGALTISTDTAQVPANLTIGALDPGQTDPTGRIHVNADGFGLINQNKQTILARNLLLQATRYEYVTWIENSTVAYDLSSNNLLFGMPPRDLLGLDVHLEYLSDGVQFQYECEWLAPTYLGGNLTYSNWTFGGDMEGILDYNAIPITSAPEWVYGLWPLIITSGAGSENGSFAWLFIGAGTEWIAHTDQMPLDLSSIASTSRTYNASGWSDLTNNTNSDPETSTDASALFCDPHMKLITVQVTLQGRQLSANVIGNSFVGNIDPAEASRMLGRSLNGIPWDSVQYEQPGLNFMSGLSQLAVKFALMNTHIPGNNQTLPLLPQSLDNITGSLQSYVPIAGANAYLDGSVGTTQVFALRSRTIERLVCSLPQWGASVALLIIIAFLLGTAISIERSEQSTLVPLTLASVVAAIGHEKPSHT